MTKANWNFDPYPPDGGDCRKLVTLEKDGMMWVGIRPWSGTQWLNNGVKEDATVVAWADLPEPAADDGLAPARAVPTL